MQVSEAEKEMYIETAKQFKGHARRLFMARVVKALGQEAPGWLAKNLAGTEIQSAKEPES